MLSELRSFLNVLLRRSPMEKALDDEIRFHLEEHAARLRRQGLSEEEARRRARSDFGSLDATREACRDSRGVNLVEEFRRNVLFAIRLLYRNPGFTVTAVLTLALGIGANTAIFSVIDAVLLRPLPYPEPEKLVRVITEFRQRDGAVGGINESQDGMAWEVLTGHEKSVDYAAIGFGGALAVASDGHSEYVPTQRVTAGYFRVLGVPLLMGREFLPEEDKPGGGAVVVLSYPLWQRYFQGTPTAIGKTILVRGEPHTVVGVAPAGFRNFQNASLWTPLRVTRSGEGSGTNYMMIGRIQSGVSFEEAQQRVRAAGQEVIQARKLPAEAEAKLGLVQLQEGLVGNDRSILLVIWGAVGVVLVIACVNVAGLLLARAETRSREIATRSALGGGSGAVIRQLITESLVLAILGGFAGVGLGYLGIQLLAAYGAEELGIWQPFGLDARVLTLSFGAALLTGILFGTLPALQTARVNLREALTLGGGRAVAGGAGHWPRRFLVAGEIALGLVLLIGAGLLIRTFVHLYNLSPGFDGTNVISTTVSMNDARYETAASVNRYFSQTLEEIRAIPGVQSAAVGLHVPFDRWLNMGVRVDSASQSDGERLGTTMNYVTAGYFETLRIPMISGRSFDESDTETAGRVAIVNQTFVRRYFAGEQALGHAVTFGGDTSPRVIVGVAGDVQQTPGLTRGTPFAPEPAIYVPSRQVFGLMTVVHTWFTPKWVIRGYSDPATLVPQIQAVFAKVDPLLPTKTFRPVEAYRGERLRFEQIQLVLLTILAALALLLGAVGVYGLISQQVRERTREMGIRITLGASRSRAVWTAALPGIVLTAAGLAFGLALSALSTRFLASRIFGVEALDPLTFLLAALFLLGVAVLASVLPALRLLRLNPAQTLRAD